ncbi:MAG: hypothetical protein J6S14_19480 [Clostridia bacterium]|nr:hypothetical protein [Clostridia bacterium]
MTGEEYAKKKRKERDHEYYLRNRERILEKNRVYREANREKIRAYHTAYMREYRSKNFVKKLESTEKND